MGIPLDCDDDRHLRGLFQTAFVEDCDFYVLSIGSTRLPGQPQRKGDFGSPTKTCLFDRTGLSSSFSQRRTSSQWPKRKFHLSIQRHGRSRSKRLQGGRPAHQCLTGFQLPLCPEVSLWFLSSCNIALLEVVFRRSHTQGKSAARQADLLRLWSSKAARDLPGNLFLGVFCFCPFLSLSK